MHVSRIFDLVIQIHDKIQLYSPAVSPGIFRDINVGDFDFWSHIISASGARQTEARGEAKPPLKPSRMRAFRSLGATANEMKKEGKRKSFSGVDIEKPQEQRRKYCNAYFRSNKYRLFPPLNSWRTFPAELSKPPSLLQRRHCVLMRTGAARGCWRWRWVRGWFYRMKFWLFSLRTCATETIKFISSAGIYFSAVIPFRILSRRAWIRTASSSSLKSGLPCRVDPAVSGSRIVSL